MKMHFLTTEESPAYRTGEPKTKCGYYLVDNPNLLVTTNFDEVTCRRCNGRWKMPDDIELLGDVYNMETGEEWPRIEVRVIDDVPLLKEGSIT